jgi:hypothetical protein
VFVGSVVFIFISIGPSVMFGIVQVGSRVVAEKAQVVCAMGRASAGSSFAID